MGFWMLGREGCSYFQTEMTITLRWTEPSSASLSKMSTALYPDYYTPIIMAFEIPQYLLGLSSLFTTIVPWFFSVHPLIPSLNVFTSSPPNYFVARNIFTIRPTASKTRPVPRASLSVTISQPSSPILFDSPPNKSNGRYFTP